VGKSVMLMAVAMIAVTTVATQPVASTRRRKLAPPQAAAAPVAKLARRAAVRVCPTQPGGTQWPGAEPP
jgi:hypothetical protein